MVWIDWRFQLGGKVDTKHLKQTKQQTHQVILDKES